MRAGISDQAAVVETDSPAPVDENEEWKSMRAIVRPHRKGEAGIVCLPMYRNVPDAGHQHPGWELTLCPCCGALCWASERTRQIVKEETNLRAMCTACALSKGEST